MPDKVWWHENKLVYQNNKLCFQEECPEDCGGFEAPRGVCSFCGDCDPPDFTYLYWDLFFNGLTPNGCADCADFDDIKLTVAGIQEDSFSCLWLLDLEFGYDHGLPCYVMGDNFNFAATFRIDTDFAGGVGYSAQINGAYYHTGFVGGAATEDCCFDELTLTTQVFNGGCSGGSVTIKPSTETAAGVYPR